MKNTILKLKFLSLIFCVLQSCKEPLVQFEVAQPENVKEEKQFPGKLIGNYHSALNTEVVIGSHFIISKIQVNDTLPMAELDKNETIVKDTLYHKITGEKYKVVVVSDSLFSNYIYADTIFDMRKSDVLKKYKGYYFLNTPIRKTDFWQVQKLNLSNGVLTLNGIATENEINLLETIAATKQDSTQPFAVKPTKKQFKEFIKKNGFSEGETYLKQ